MYNLLDLSLFVPNARTHTQQSAVFFSFFFVAFTTQTQGIEIPAVLVSHATGERLWSNRSWIPGRPGRLKASVGATGHFVLQPRPVGALEMLGIYLLLSVLLLAFSGVCGLLFALAFTW